VNLLCNVWQDASLALPQATRLKNHYRRCDYEPSWDLLDKQVDGASSASCAGFNDRSLPDSAESASVAIATHPHFEPPFFNLAQQSSHADPSSSSFSNYDQ